MSKELQHSPGPFAYSTWDGECIILDAEGNCIADLMSSRHHGDGHLFAAAPTMLRLLRVFAVPITQLRRLSDGELRAALEETAELVSRLDGAE